MNHRVIGAEEMIGKTGVWAKTHFRRDGRYLVSDTYLVAAGNPRVVSLRIDLAPLARFAKRLHRQLHQSDPSVGYSLEDSGAVGRQAVRLGRSKLVRHVAQQVKAAAKQKPAKLGDALTAFPMTTGLGLATVGAYAAANATVKALENGKRLRDDVVSIRRQLDAGKRALAHLEADAARGGPGGAIVGHVDERELAEGTAQEMAEHGMSRRQGRRTALEHLSEHPHYYSQMRRCFGVAGEPLSNEARAWLRRSVRRSRPGQPGDPDAIVIDVSDTPALAAPSVGFSISFPAPAPIKKIIRPTQRKIITEAAKKRGLPPARIEALLKKMGRSATVTVDHKDVMKSAAMVAAIAATAGAGAALVVPAGGLGTVGLAVADKVMAAKEAGGKYADDARKLYDRTAALAADGYEDAKRGLAQLDYAAELRARVGARAGQPLAQYGNLPKSAISKVIKKVSFRAPTTMASKALRAAKRAAAGSISSSAAKGNAALAAQAARAKHARAVAMAQARRARLPAKMSKSVAKKVIAQQMSKKRWTEADFAHYMLAHLAAYPTSDPRRVSGATLERVVSTHNARRASRGLPKKSEADFRYHAAYHAWPTRRARSPVSPPVRTRSGPSHATKAAQLAVAARAVQLKKRLADSQAKAKMLLIKKKADAARAEVERIRNRADLATGSDALDAAKNATIVNLAAKNRARIRAMASQAAGGLPGLLIDSRGRIRPGRFRLAPDPPGLNPNRLYRGPNEPAPRGPFEQVAGMPPLLAGMPPLLAGMPPWMPPLSPSEQGSRSKEISRWFRTRSPQSLVIRAADTPSRPLIGCPDDPNCHC